MKKQENENGAARWEDDGVASWYGKGAASWMPITTLPMAFFSSHWF